MMTMRMNIFMLIINYILDSKKMMMMMTMTGCIWAEVGEGEIASSQSNFESSGPACFGHLNLAQLNSTKFIQINLQYFDFTLIFHLDLLNIESEKSWIIFFILRVVGYWFRIVQPRFSCFEMLSEPFCNLVTPLTEMDCHLFHQTAQTQIRRN